jgi:hypothetical protein
MLEHAHKVKQGELSRSSVHRLLQGVGISARPVPRSLGRAAELPADSARGMPRASAPRPLAALAWRPWADRVRGAEQLTDRAMGDACGLEVSRRHGARQVLGQQRRIATDRDR